MNITQTDQDNIKIIGISGKFDTLTAPEVEKAIMKCIDDGVRKMIINLEETQYVSSSGLRVMLATAKKLKNNGELRISNLNDMVEEVFAISGFSTILTVTKTVDEAIVSMN